MSGTYVVRPQVKRDIIRHATYIARDNLDAALRFRHAAQETFEVTAVTPRGYGLVKPLQGQFPGLRCRPLKRPFELYLAFYFVREGDRVEFTRVLHGRRDIPRVYPKLKDG